MSAATKGPIDNTRGGRQCDGILSSSGTKRNRNAASAIIVHSAVYIFVLFSYFLAHVNRSVHRKLDIDPHIATLQFALPLHLSHNSKEVSLVYRNV